MTGLNTPNTRRYICNSIASQVFIALSTCQMVNLGDRGERRKVMLRRINIRNKTAYKK